MTSVEANSAVQLVERDVRELLARRDLPLDDDGRLRALVDEVVGDYRERYLDGGLPALTDRDVELLHQRIIDFGVITPLLG